MELIRPVRGKHGGKQVEEEIPRNSIMEEAGNEINLRGIVKRMRENKNSTCGSKATDISSGGGLCWAQEVWRMPWRLGAPFQLPVGTSIENTQHLSSARRELQS